MYGQSNSGMYSRKNTYKSYEGFIEDDSFKFRRILKWGWNSFIPIVKGEVIQKKSGGSKIRIKIRFHKIVIIFLLIYLLFGASQFIINVNNSLAENHNLNQLLKEYNIEPIEVPSESKSYNWLNSLFVLTPYFFALIMFNYEATKVKTKLKAILKVE